MGNVYAVRAAFIYSWKMTTGGGRFLSFLGTLIFVVALGWFAHESGDPAVVTYLAIGAYMMVVWNFCVSRMGWSLRGELVQGTLELMLMSRTPIMTILRRNARLFCAFLCMQADWSLTSPGYPQRAALAA
jgi:hypothetical protein